MKIDKNKIEDFIVHFVAVIFAIAITLAIMAITFGITFGVLYFLCWLFRLAFSWQIAFGIWLLVEVVICIRNKW